MSQESTIQDTSNEVYFAEIGTAEFINFQARKPYLKNLEKDIYRDKDTDEYICFSPWGVSRSHNLSKLLSKVGEAITAAKKAYISTMML